MCGAHEAAVVKFHKVSKRSHSSRPAWRRGQWNRLINAIGFEFYDVYKVSFITEVSPISPVEQSRRLVQLSVSKWLKLTQFHLLTSLFDLEKATLQWGNLQEVGKTSHQGWNIYFCKFLNWKCLPPAVYHENSWASMVSNRDFLQ